MINIKDIKNMFEEMIEVVNENGLDGMPAIMEVLFNHAMQVERSKVLQAAPYQRSATRRGYANGFKPKRVNTRMGKLNLQIPQVRGDVEFYPSSLEKGLRSERALKIALSEMYIKGVSTRKTKDIMEHLCGFEVSATQVSEASKALDKSLEQWRQRPLDVLYPYVYLDAQYQKVRIGGVVQDVALLLAIGVNRQGKRSVLGISVASSEAQVHWHTFLESLKNRGLQGVELFISDNHSGLESARKRVFNETPWQRCQFHLQQNAQHYVTKHSLKEKIAWEIRKIFNSENVAEAQSRLMEVVQKYKKSQPKLVDWMEANLEEGFTVFNFPKEHRKRLRTTNPLERLNREIKRRTRTVSIFPNEASLLRLASAILVEQDETWSTQLLPYLTFKS